MFVSRLEKFVSNEHSSSLLKFVNHGQKSFITLAPDATESSTKNTKHSLKVKKEFKLKMCKQQFLSLFLSFLSFTFV
jgi:hypothetical protein